MSSLMAFVNKQAVGGEYKLQCVSEGERRSYGPWVYAIRGLQPLHAWSSVCEMISRQIGQVH